MKRNPNKTHSLFYSIALHMSTSAHLFIIYSKCLVKIHIGRNIQKVERYYIRRYLSVMSLPRINLERKIMNDYSGGVEGESKIRWNNARGSKPLASSHPVHSTYVSKFVVEQELFCRLSHVVRFPSNKLQMENTFRINARINDALTYKWAPHHHRWTTTPPTTSHWVNRTN